MRAWSGAVVIPTYMPGEPDHSPMFTDRRVYQGSSGRVYPNPIVERIASEPEDRTWQAVHLENEYVRLVILPEVGGRIHVGQDRTNGYDFFYRATVIKPALVGLLGPWISGGVEFNWPQHHRPSTFMPVDWSIQEHADGARTVWLSEHEPMNRMKGMVGVTLRPGSSLVECEARLHNRTPFVQTFLWWANVGVRVHDEYEVFFPQDVRYVADHAKRTMTDFPRATGTYYGVDYGAWHEGGTDLRWYRNIPVPTSYMATGSHHDFFGGYDHRARAGLVHVADHRIAPGKKLWTWGDHEFGHAWNRHLTDEDGPYVELMAGIYTDNQPDFSFLAPYETRTFRQHWYPIREIGPATMANLHVAVSLRLDGGVARVGVSATGVFVGAMVRLELDGAAVAEWRADLAPDAPLVTDVPLGADVRLTALRLSVSAADGRVLVDHVPEEMEPSPLPSPATEPPPPAEVATVEQLYLTGLHLDQYRHATRSPEPYWREALRRDPGDARANAALGGWHLRRGDFATAQVHFGVAVARLTERNPNPRDGEALYGLGLALWYRGQHEAAYDAFAKAAWSAPWRSAAHHRLALIDAASGSPADALAHVDAALRTNADDSGARNLRCALLRRLGRASEALDGAEATLAIDPLDLWAALERHWAAMVLGTPSEAPIHGDAQACLDVAFDLGAAGLWTDAIEALEHGLTRDPARRADPLLRYHLGWLHERAGHPDEAARQRAIGRQAPEAASFAGRLEEIASLEAAAAADPADPRPLYHLGNLLYDRHRRREAIARWELAAHLDPNHSTTWRNLGVAYYNVDRRPRKAERAYRRALAAAPADGRLLYEWDQLRGRLGVDAARRLAALDAHPGLVAQRDDLSVERITLMNRLGRHDEALGALSSRRFAPWEGGEGAVSRQYVLARVRLAQRALADGQPADARAHLTAATTYPENIGEGRHLLTSEHVIHYHLGLADAQLGDDGAARSWWERASDPRPSVEPPTAPMPTASEATYWRALSLRRLGREDAASPLLREMRRAARRLARTESRVDYFATSLPTLVLFEDDQAAPALANARYLEGLAEAGLGRVREARAALAAALVLDKGHEAAAAMLQTIAAGADNPCRDPESAGPPVSPTGRPAAARRGDPPTAAGSTPRPTT